VSAVTPEPTNIPETLPELRTFLQAAIELEHLTIPPYLTAMYTLKPGSNVAAYDVIRSVVVEEMLHMSLAANLLTAVGGTPDIAHPEFVRAYPARLPYSGLPMLIPLASFAPETIDTFLAIERPAPPDTPPDDQGWVSIAQFYAALRLGLERIVAREGPERVFTGDPEHQIGPDDVYNSGGEVVEVVDLRTAREAIEIIVDQGEGAHESIFEEGAAVGGPLPELAHYYRYNEIRLGRRYDRHDTADSGPTGPALSVHWDQVYRIDPAARVSAYPAGSAVRAHAEEFNLRYAELLQHIQQGVTGRPEAMRAAIPAMLRLKYQAQTLLANPFPGRPGLHASPTFEIDDTVLGRAADRLAAAAPIPH
jgi:hypothetical protein